jgi:tRNA/tmRNA/rRNA uracil-C5-methylase (TrmA/RlmC/RlmD family)
VAAPCQFAGPGKCGGCDWQHVSPARQRELKREVVLEQFRRFARLDVADLLADVEELPGGALGWRTRVAYAVDRSGQVGLRRHRSHEVEIVDRCLLGTSGVGDAEELEQTWPGLSGLEIVASSAGDGATTVIGHRPGAPRKGRGRRAPDRLQVLAGSSRLHHQVGAHALEVAAEGFWQVHPHALETITAAVLSFAELAAGERVLELYAGAGALTVSLADAVGAKGSVVGFEGAAQAVADAEGNLAELPQAEIRQAQVAASLVSGAEAADVVVLDPPRTGAGAETMRAICAVGARAIVYVACDPVALARDVGVAAEAGWRLAALRAIDAFPMTHHVECVALLLPGASP